MQKFMWESHLGKQREEAGRQGGASGRDADPKGPVPPGPWALEQSVSIPGDPSWGQLWLGPPR